MERDSATFRDKGTEVPSMSWEKSFCPWMSWDRGVCPGTFAPALFPGQRELGKENFLVLGQKDNVMSCPGLSRDSPFCGNTASDPPIFSKFPMAMPSTQEIFCVILQTVQK